MYEDECFSLAGVEGGRRGYQNLVQY